MKPLLVGATSVAAFLAAFGAPAAAPSTLPLARLSGPQVQIRGQDAVVPVGCHQSGMRSCTGRIALRARLGGGKSAIVGRRSFTVSNGMTAAVRVRLTAVAREFIADSQGRLTVTAKATTDRASGDDAVHSRQLVLRSRASAPSDDVPELTWVMFVSPPTFEYSQCGAKPMSFKYKTSGKTNDRLPGTFSEEGSWVQTGGNPKAWVGPLKTTFTIISGPWVITGTKSMDMKVACEGEDREWGYGTYEATLTKTEGSGADATTRTYKDKGLAFAFEDLDTGEVHAGFMTGQGGSSAGSATRGKR